MLINRECDYGLRIIRNLSDDEVVSIREVAEREMISNAIAYKVAGKLEKGGLVTSMRGNKGGYMLTRPLDRITILDVYNIMEPDACINECLKPGYECPIHTIQGRRCGVHQELKRIQDVLFRELSSKTINELA